MRTQLEQFRDLFEQVRGLGIVMQLPNDTHTYLSKNLKVWFADDRNTTAVCFGQYRNEVEIMKYSFGEWGYKISFRMDLTDEELNEVLVDATTEYMKVKWDYFKDNIENQLIEESVEEVVS